MIRTVNLGLAFLLELAVLFAVGGWGFTLAQGWPVRLLAAVGGVLLMAVLWGVFAAPRAFAQLPGVAGVAFRIAWFGVGALALWATGLPIAAMGLVVLSVVSALMLRGL